MRVSLFRQLRGWFPARRIQRRGAAQAMDSVSSPSASHSPFLFLGRSFTTRGQEGEDGVTQMEDRQLPVSGVGDRRKELSQEALQDQQHKFVQNVDKIDEDDDGVLSPEEFEKFLTLEQFYTKFQRRGFMRSSDFRSKYSDLREKPEALEGDEKTLHEPVPQDPIDQLRNDGLKPEWWQIHALFLRSSVPFFGFGFVDNVIMILAGEMIDARLGGTFHLSTLAAAGLGNLLSDVAGIGLGGIIEEMSGKMGLPDPKMTYQQLESISSKVARHLAAVFGIALGCLAGMIPLLFMSTDKQEARHALRHFDADENKEITAEQCKEGLAKLGLALNDEQLRTIFGEGGGKITVAEFWNRAMSH